MVDGIMAGVCGREGKKKALGETEIQRFFCFIIILPLKLTRTP
jgi:hypothetical protein